MPSPNNPYEPPTTGQARKSPDTSNRLRHGDKLGIGFAILVTSLAILLDPVFDLSSQLQKASYDLMIQIIVLLPPALFFLISVWVHIAVTRDSTRSLIRRISTAILIAFATVPACSILLFFTCTPATQVTGVGWRLYGDPWTRLEATIFAFTTCVCVIGIAVPLAMVMRATRARRPEGGTGDQTSN